MIKLVFGIVRKDGLTGEECPSSWRNEHARLPIFYAEEHVVIG